MRFEIATAKTASPSFVPNWPDLLSDLESTCDELATPPPDRPWKTALKGPCWCDKQGEEDEYRCAKCVYTLPAATLYMLCSARPMGKSSRGALFAVGKATESKHRVLSIYTWGPVIRSWFPREKRKNNSSSGFYYVPPDHLLLDRSPNIGPLMSRWELDKFKNCWNKSFRSSRILTLLYQQFSNLLISQRNMSGPWLGALSNNR
jgi:hypothetical protein